MRNSLEYMGVQETEGREDVLLGSKCFPRSQPREQRLNERS